jgi:phage/plasmid-associated DNA primase
MSMEYELKHGQALVITGPQGCGKSTLARRIAKKHGRFVETEAHQLETHRGLNDLLASEPSTVICDGLPASEDTQARLKALITGDTVKVDRKYGAPKMVKAPNFIFCTGDADPLPLVAADRRFRVVQIGTPA